MKNLLIILAVAATLAIPGICSATPPRQGPYVSGFLGVSVPQNTNVTGFDYYLNKSFDERVEFDPGINIGGTGGFDYGVIRLEGEMSYKQGNISNISDQHGIYQHRNVDGTLGAFAMMFNTFLDLHNSSPVTPYLGGGIGFAVMHLSDTFVHGNPLPVYREDDDSVFAYQAGGGLDIALNHRLSLDLGYRYFATSKARFYTNRDIDADLEFQSHNAAVGLRVKF